MEKILVICQKIVFKFCPQLSNFQNVIFNKILTQSLLFIAYSSFDNNFEKKKEWDKPAALVVDLERNLGGGWW